MNFPTLPEMKPRGLSGVAEALNRLIHEMRALGMEPPLALVLARPDDMVIVMANANAHELLHQTYFQHDRNGDVNTHCKVLGVEFIAPSRRYADPGGGWCYTP